MFTNYVILSGNAFFALAVVVTGQHSLGETSEILPEVEGETAATIVQWYA